MDDVPDTSVDIFTSMQRPDCDERAFVLAAVGIGSQIAFDGSRYLLAVDPADVRSAQQQLHSYDAERPHDRAPAPEPAPLTHRGAWVGCVAYVLVLMGVALALSNGVGPLDAFDRGSLDASKVRTGEWWRAWTALTLHWDAAHLVANLGAGVWFGYLAARQLGVGTSWLLIVTGAAAANLFDAHFGPPLYRSAGASTMVFTALGVLAAHSWRSRLHLQQRWAQRWAPLVGGLALLGWFGTAGEGTDLVAHALGFVCGGLLGVSAAIPAVERSLSRMPQWLMGLAALGSLAFAWWRAANR